MHEDTCCEMQQKMQGQLLAACIFKQQINYQVDMARLT